MPNTYRARVLFVLVALFAGGLGLSLAGCGPTIGLAPGLVARMDVAGARLDVDTALGLVNHLRSDRGAPALVRDAGLEAAAQKAADAYAAQARSPQRPAPAKAFLTSAGYVSFAETFSGWRASTDDTRTLSDPDMRRAGLAVSTDSATEFGTYWVLLLAP